MNPFLKRKKKTLHEAWVFRYLYTLNRVIKPPLIDQIHQLSAQETKELKVLKFGTLFTSGFLGLAGVLLLYLPRQLYPSLFETNRLDMPWIGIVEISLSFTLYGFILAWVEIGALTILHVHLVKRMAAICGFPPLESDFSTHIQALTDVSLEKPAKRILEFGINPLAGLPKFGLFMFTSLYSLKATLSNLFVKFVLGRVLGRLYLKTYIDYIGIPIFAFWNIFATNKIINEAVLRIMAPNIIKNLVNELSKYKNDKDYERILFDSLQFMAVTKRDFHHNHFLLINQVFNAFDLDKSIITTHYEDFIVQLATLPKPQAVLVVKLLVLGLIIDGSLSAREIKVIKKLNQTNLLLANTTTVKKWMNDFKMGKGLQYFVHLAHI